MMDLRVARMHGHGDGLTPVEALSFACVVELENGRLIVSHASDFLHSRASKSSCAGHVHE
jgi:hypothetical protein